MLSKWRVLVPTALILLVLVSVWVSNTHQSGPLAGLPDILRPVREATAMFSSRSQFVIPGSELSFNADSPTYRSGFTAGDDSIDSALDALVKLKADHPKSRDLLCGLTKGFLVTRQFNMAGDYGREAHRLFPDDIEITLLQALVEFFEGDLNESERLHREVLVKDPDHPTALLNLAVVLRKKHNYTKARTLLEQVISDHPDSRMADRAQQLLPDI